MMMQRLRYNNNSICVFVFAAFVIGWGFCADYYVAPDGCDTQPGSLSSPFATIQKAANTVKPGDRCLIRGGTYRETVKLRISGSENNPITFTNYKAEKVILDGTDILTVNWSLHDGRIYKAQTEKVFEQLFADGAMMIEARWPNIQSPDGSFDRSTWAYVNAGSLGTLTDHDLPSSGVADWTGAYGVFNLSQQMHSWPRRVTSHSGRTLTYDITGINIGLNASFNDDRYYLFGTLAALDMSGEWFLDTDTHTVYLWTKKGDTPANYTITVKQRNYGFDAAPNTNHIVIKGIHFFGCEFRFPKFCHCITIDDCHLRYTNYARTIPALQTGGSIYNPSPHLAGRHLTVQNCTIAHAQTNGLLLIGSHVTATNNLIYDVNWNGSNTFSALTVVTPLGLDSIYGVGNSLASDNTIYNTGNVGIKFRQPNSTAEYNDLFHGGLSAKDTTLLYSSGTFPNLLFQYNWLHDNHSWDGGGLGFRLDGNPGKDQTEKATVRGNVVWNCGGRGFVIKGLDHRVYHNTVLGEINVMFDTHQDSRIYNNYAHSFTFTRGATQGAVGFYSNNSTISNPQLTDPANFDFVPVATSPLRDAGTASPSDYQWHWQGQAPDIGAYERGLAARRIPGYKPIRAHSPQPHDGAGHIDPQAVTLFWKPAYHEPFAQTNPPSYDLYFGTSLAAVSSADNASPEFKGHRKDLSCTLEALEPNTPYYWRVDTLDEHKNRIHYGHIWSFTTGGGAVALVRTFQPAEDTFIHEAAPDTPPGDSPKVDREDGTPGEFVTRKGSKLWYRGKEYRALGVNTINLHLSYARKWFHDGIYTANGEDPREMMLKGLDDARDSGFKFVRFFASPGYPKTMDLFYLKDKDAYWKNMDEVVQECQKRDLKLIPSLGVVFTFTQYHGEPAQAILNPDSRGYKESYQYIEEFVTRYKDSPTILMWEIYNELMLKADVNQAGKSVIPGIFTGGKAPRPEETIEDSLSYDQIVSIYREMSNFIRTIDKNHLITSGDSKVRTECTSRRQSFPNFKFRTDTLDEWIANNINAQPEPLDVYSLHIYDPYGVRAKGEIAQMNCKNNMELFEKLITAMRKSGRPVLIGEFGKNWQDGKDTHPQEVLDMMKMFDRTGVSLMCFWAWHFKWQDKTFNTTSSSQPNIVRYVKALNEGYGN